MKKLLLLLGAYMAFCTAQAQYYYVPSSGANPGNINTDTEYPPGGGLPAGWTTLMGSATVATPLSWSPVVNLPFAFSFNGTPVTSYKVSTSGVMTFNTAAVTVPPATKAALPSADIPDNSVMVWGLYCHAGDYIVHKTFGTAPNRQHWLQFNSFSHTPSVVSTNWTYWSIVLEETTNKIYIVDQRTSGTAPSLTAGIQVNGTTAFMVSGSPNLGSQSTNDPTAVDNTVFAFSPGTQPNYDMSVTAVTNATYLTLPNAPFTITGSIKNLGALPVTSFTLNYAINGGTPVAATVTANVAPMGSYSFNHPTTWTPSAPGVYTITAWATNINGSNADQNTANDVGSKQVTVAANVVPRIVLHEVFTSSTCPPCLPGNANLRTITKANPGKSIDIKYQQNFPAPGNDPYQSAESINRRGYYGVNSIPRMEVDGGWDGNANSYTTSLLNSFKAKPALVSISGTHTIVGNTITANAVIDPIGNSIPSNNLVVQMAITEKYNTGNIRTNGETEFYDVMKKMMPNENGTAIAPLVAGTTRSLSQTYTFPAVNIVENFDSLRIVIFLQDKVTKEVFQSAFSTRITNPTGVSENAAAAMLNVYPNPTNGMVNVTYNVKAGEAASLTVFNMLGQEVYSKAVKGSANSGQLDIDLSGQAAGFYLLNLQLGDQVITKKISLVK